MSEQQTRYLTSNKKNIIKAHHIDQDIDTKKFAYHYISTAPLSLCIREISRIKTIEMLKNNYLNKKKDLSIIDIGCGDGFWWNFQKNNNWDIYGIDISKTEITQAQKHINASFCDISKDIPFNGKKFDICVGNCSLEHIKNIHNAFDNISKITNESSTLIIFIPKYDWAFEGRLQTLLLNKYPRVAMLISGAINGFFQHWHLYSEKTWKLILKEHNWEVVESYGLGDKKSNFVFRAALIPSMFSFVFKSIFNIYPNRILRFFPHYFRKKYAQFIDHILKNVITSSDNKHAYEYTLIAKKVK